MKGLAPNDPLYLDVTPEQMFLELALEEETTKSPEERVREENERFFAEEASHDGESAPMEPHGYSEQEKTAALLEAQRLLHGGSWQEESPWMEDDPVEG